MLQSQAKTIRSAIGWENDTQRAFVPLTISALDATASRLAMTRFRTEVGAVLSRGLPLSVVVADLQQGPSAAAVFRYICALLSECADAHDVSPTQIEIAVAAGSMRPREAWQVRQEALGSGALYLLASDKELRVRATGRARFHQFWRELWLLQSQGYVRLASTPLILSRCPLLSGEPGNTVLPVAALQVPTGSAWIIQQLSLCDFASDDGVLDKPALQCVLLHCIERGLELHQRANWPNAAMRHDSWLNRRLAITITGIGDLVVRRQQDPRQLECLQDLRETMQWIQSLLNTHSQRVTDYMGTVPVLERSNPVRTVTSDDDRWARRWHAAVTKHATASRNLLALSPWSVFPAAADPDPVFSNLLPLLEFADACAFPEPPRFNGWNINDFIQLHQRIWAVCERREASQRFAEQV